jgi:hypothetical protein
MNSQEVREELDHAPGIDTAGVNDGYGEVPEMQSRGPTRASENGDDETDESDGDYVSEEDGEDEDKEQLEVEYHDFDESGGDDYAANLEGAHRGGLAASAPDRLVHSLFTSLSCIHHGRQVQRAGPQSSWRASDSTGQLREYTRLARISPPWLMRCIATRHQPTSPCERYHATNTPRKRFYGREYCR